MVLAEGLDKSETFIAYMGSVPLIKSFCETCGSTVLVIDGKFACCGEVCKSKPTAVKRESLAPNCRKTPSPTEMQLILENQKFRCIYCGGVFGESEKRKNKVLEIKLVWEHFVPFALTQNNRVENFLASCEVCNLIKSDNWFDSIEEARNFILRRRKQKGYEVFILREKSPVDKDNEEVLLKYMSDKIQHSDRRANKNRKTFCNGQTNGDNLENKSNKCPKENIKKGIKSRKGFGANGDLSDQHSKNETEYKPNSSLMSWLQNYIVGNADNRQKVCDFTKKSRTTIEAYANNTYFLAKEKGGLGVKSSNIEEKIKDFKDFMEDEGIQIESKIKDQKVISLTPQKEQFIFVNMKGEKVFEICFENFQITSLNYK